MNIISITQYIYLLLWLCDVEGISFKTVSNHHKNFVHQQNLQMCTISADLLFAVWCALIDLMFVLFSIFIVSVA